MTANSGQQPVDSARAATDRLEAVCHLSSVFSLLFYPTPIEVSQECSGESTDFRERERLLPRLETLRIGGALGVEEEEVCRRVVVAQTHQAAESVIAGEGEFSARFIEFCKGVATISFRKAPRIVWARSILVIMVDVLRDEHRAFGLRGGEFGKIERALQVGGDAERLEEGSCA